VFRPLKTINTVKSKFSALNTVRHQEVDTGFDSVDPGFRKRRHISRVHLHTFCDCRLASI
jgi:tRNA U34 5-methylaminomethyl-2-thiouridine-forming methyltransferase MnmC